MLTPTTYAQVKGLDAWRSNDCARDASSEFAHKDFDDSSWERVNEPSTPHQEARQFRSWFTAEGEAGKRYFLEFDRIMSDTSVWLDGTYLGDVETSLLPSRFEVTQQCLASDQHQLAIRTNPDSWIASDFERPQLIETGSVHMSRIKALCTEASADRAEIGIWCELDSTENTAISVVVDVSNPALEYSSTHNHVLTVGPGKSRHHWTISFDDVQLWWPVDLGEQVLYDLDIELRTQHSAHTASDKHSGTIGFREIEIDPTTNLVSINGRRHFLRATFASSASDPVPNGMNCVVADRYQTLIDLTEHANRAGLMLVKSISPIPSIQNPLRSHSVLGIGIETPAQMRQAAEALGNESAFLGWSNRPTRWKPPRVARAAVRQQTRLLKRTDPTRRLVEHLPLANSTQQVEDVRRNRKSHPGFVVADPAKVDLQSVAPIAVIAKARGSKILQNQTIDIYVINDSPFRLEDCKLAAELSEANGPGTLQWSWKGSLPSDCAALVGKLKPKAGIDLGKSSLDTHFSGNFGETRRKISPVVEYGGHL
jgi:hypothetical protein